MAFASAGWLSEYWSSIATERIAATGLTMPLPAMSGAEPVEEKGVSGLAIVVGFPWWKSRNEVVCLDVKRVGDMVG